MKRNKLPKPPRPEVCDACFLEGHLSWNDDSSEWLCTQCNALIREERQLLDYEDGKKLSNNDDNW